MNGTATRRAALACIAPLLLAACAQPPRRQSNALSTSPSWSGRLSLRLDTEPVQYFSATFDLTGQIETGQLNLYSPLGQTLGRLSWSDTGADWQAQGEVRRFASLDEALRQTTGAPLPVQALFDWLRGRDAQAPGWQPDLTRLSEGRLTASRLEPLPTAELRVILDR